MSASVYNRIKNRLHDEELSVDDAPGGAVDALVRQLDAYEAGLLLATLKRMQRAYVDHRNRSRGSMPWRYGQVISALQRDLDRRKEVKGTAARAAGAAVSRATGRETCTCGQRHPYGANFYVSVVDGGRTGLLDGPYRTHAEALDNVERVRELAQATDPRAQWYSFGTVAMPRSHKKPGLFNR